MIMRISGLLIFIFIFFNAAYAQEDEFIESMHDQGKKKVYNTFNGMRLINVNTTKTLEKGKLDFLITHRFGNISGGFHSLWGFDNAANIRLAFNYGITDKLMVGVGRSKVREHIDGFVRYRFIEQKEKGVPVSVAFQGNTAFSPMKSLVLYSESVSEDPPTDFQKWEHRLSYTSQLIVGTKLSPYLSLELAPTFVYRNYVPSVRLSNGEVISDENELFSLGAGAKVQVSHTVSIVLDYFHTFSNYRKKIEEDGLGSYYPPIGIGVELKTGGHIFFLNFTNSVGIIENDIIPYTHSSWEEGDIKFGFTISRKFN